MERRIEYHRRAMQRGGVGRAALYHVHEVDADPYGDQDLWMHAATPTPLGGSQHLDSADSAASDEQHDFDDSIGPEGLGADISGVWAQHVDPDRHVEPGGNGPGLGYHHLNGGWSNHEDRSPGQAAH